MLDNFYDNDKLAAISVFAGGFGQRVYLTR